MSTRKIVLAILALLASVPIAQAQGSNPRYPAYAGSYGYSSQVASSSPKRAYFPPQDAWMSRASRSYGGGGY